jgi:uncharacterized protein with HEPN domain
MTLHDPMVSLRQMLEYARRARRIAGSMTGDEIAGHDVLSLAIPHALELVGEAANRITPVDRQRYPSIPWRLIVSMRNRLAHGYDSVNFRVVADALQYDIPPLIEALEDLLREFEGHAD